MTDLRLSEQQIQAIKDVQGASLLLAVPGSGKTTTLIARIGRMIYDFGIDPNQILVINSTTSRTTSTPATGSSIPSNGRAASAAA